MADCKAISILGVTGSVGKSAMDVVLSAPERFHVRSVTAHQNVDLLVQRAVALKAGSAVIADEAQYGALKTALSGTGVEALAGSDAIDAVAGEAGLDLVVAAIVGLAGLDPLMAAIGQGTNVAIANKEPLVAAGELVMAAARKSGSVILPIDSEHNAIFQVFESSNLDAIERLILTASGGPFRNWSAQDMRKATKAQALKHPNWEMGAKISIDSATMMNKALEVIEAHYLFGMPADKIKILVHPQSVVHSMVEYYDGSVLAQLGASDMCTPVAHAMAWPERMKTPGERLDLTAIHMLSFEEPNFERFPALRYAYDCLDQGMTHAIAMNAANEIAVAEFLKERIGFGDIVDIVGHILHDFQYKPVKRLSDVKDLDRIVRQRTQEMIESD